MYQFASVSSEPLRRLFAFFRQKSQGVSARVLFAIALAFAFVAAGLNMVTALALKDAESERVSLSDDLKSLENEVATRRLQRDFVQKLPTASQASLVTAKIQRLVQSHHVRLSTLSVHHNPSTNKALANTEWVILLRGTYPDIKSALAELLERLPSLRIQTLKFDKTSQQDIEAQVSLVEWLAPSSAESISK